MRTWVTHPDNADWLRRMLQPATRTDYGIVQRIEFPPEIMTDWRMDRTKPSGLYGLPDGRIVDLADVRADFGFVSYGPEDIWYLVGMGIVHEIRVPLAIERRKPLFPVFHSLGGQDSRPKGNHDSRHRITQPGRRWCLEYRGSGANPPAGLFHG